MVPKPVEESKISVPVEALPASRPRVDWGDALAIPLFYGREGELDHLTQWVVQERCRVVSVLGMGGIGKSALSVRSMYQVAEQFEVVIFRSLRDAPPCETLLDSCLQVLSPQRLRREGQIAVSLHHQHIVHVYDYGDRVQAETGDGADSADSDELSVPYIVMEHVQGGSLKEQLVSGQAYPLDELVCIFEQLCAAVQYVHSKGLIHRDIKPANILFREPLQTGKQVEVVLSDFGLAVSDNATLTQPYAGTFAYMAPEQQYGEPQFASDVFSLGVIFYQLCTGRLPSSLRLPEKPSQLNPDLPSALDDVVLRALSNDPLQRFASPLLFWQAVQGALGSTPPHPVPLLVPDHSIRRGRRKTPIVALAAALVAVMLLLQNSWAASTNLGSAAATITLAGKLVQDTYQIQGVTDSTNLGDHQIAVHQLTSTKKATKAVNATGPGHVAGALRVCWYLQVTV